MDYAIDGPCKCTVAELADAIERYCKEASGFSGYLASLLLGFSSDVPMMLGGGIVFGNWDSVEGIGDEPLKKAAAKFRGVGRVVRLLHGRKPLEKILETHGDAVSKFLSRLEPLAEKQEVVRKYISMQNETRQPMHNTGNGEPLRHTVELLEALVCTDDWHGVRDLAERTMDVSEGASRIRVSRILALCLHGQQRRAIRPVLSTCTSRLWSPMKRSPGIMERLRHSWRNWRGAKKPRGSFAMACGGFPTGLQGSWRLA